MDQHELAEKLYEDNRSDLGDGDFTWNVSWDEAGEIIRRENARQDAWEDYRAGFGEGEVVPSIWDNKRAPTPIVVPGESGGEAIGVALVALLIGGGYALYKWGSNDPQTSTPEPEISPSHTEDMKKLVRRNKKLADEIRESRNTNNQLTHHEGLFDEVRGDLQKHLEQPGSMFYLSTEYSVASLDAHFRRFKDPKDIDKFILGETRTKVLEMAELWKVAIA